MTSEDNSGQHEITFTVSYDNPRVWLQFFFKYVYVYIYLQDLVLFLTETDRKLLKTVKLMLKLVSTAGRAEFSVVRLDDKSVALNHQNVDMWFSTVALQYDVFTKKWIIFSGQLCAL